MEYMYLGWYVIVCGRNGEGYDSSSCTWSICILAGTLLCVGGMVRAMIAVPAYGVCILYGTLLCVGGMVRAMIAAPAHGVYVSWLVRYCVWEEW